MTVEEGPEVSFRVASMRDNALALQVAHVVFESAMYDPMARSPEDTAKHALENGMQWLLTGKASTSSEATLFSEDERKEATYRRDLLAEFARRVNQARQLTDG